MALWFPIKFNICQHVEYTKPVFFGEDWQIFETDNNIIFVFKSNLFEKWQKLNLLDETMYIKFSYRQTNYFYIMSDKNYILQPLNKYRRFIDVNDAYSLSAALCSTRKKISENISLANGIFIEKYSLVLPVFLLSEHIDDDIIFGMWLTGGVNISACSTKRLSQLVGWSEDILIDIIKKDNAIFKEKKFKQAHIDKMVKENSKERFSLPGRPSLENFFNEYVIDIINNREKYKALGIDSPSAIILQGPPGCGKTYAVEQLVNFLNWPAYNIEATAIASPYIHETSKKIAEIFEDAIKNSPSALIIDEMEAFLSNRDNSIGHHFIEEMAEFLKRIPEAIANNVLIIAMTNKIDMIDPAILRRGRFDHIVKVDFASAIEIKAMLKNLLSKIAVEDDLELDLFAEQLDGKPLSDVAFFLKEGARFAVKSKKDKLDNDSLRKALKSVVSTKRTKDKKSRVGFI
ncbi:MAG: ATP-binding protein [Campylobacteraceae bacterium]|jgi:Cdc6-like AAA superfamily ATPase|nr:ATP-binding protein [Campylobacteraceae bacterium]